MKLKFLSALLLSSALASAAAAAAAAAPDRASEKAWQIGDIVEFAAVEVPGTPQIQKADSGECFLIRMPERVPLLWKVAEVDQERERILLVALHGIKASSYCYPSDLEASPGCSFADSVIAGEHLNGLETDSLMQTISEEELVPYDNESGLYFFILSPTEAKKYFPSPEDRLLYPLTASYARPTRADLDSRNYGWWWLRGGGQEPQVPFVDFSGRLHPEGTQPFHGGGLVRPAVWIRTEAFTGHRSPHGSTVTLGRWFRKGEGIWEPLKWTVLTEDREKHRLLVITEEGIGFRSFNYEDSDNKDDPFAWDWKKSTIRAFLNDDFLREAFTPEERKRIQKTLVLSNRMIFPEGDPAAETEDRIFLPDADMVMRYKPEFALRNARINPYVQKGHRRKISGTGHKYPPLILLRERSLGIECYDGCTTMQHMENGHLSTDGSLSARDGFVIRPVMWISAE